MCLVSDPEKALAWLQKSAQLEPANAMLHYHIAELLTEHTASQPDLCRPAINYLDSSINLMDSSNAFWDSAHLMRGNCYSRLGLPGEALANYSKALEKRSDNPEAYYRRGVALWRFGELDHAKADLSKAVTLSQCRNNPYSVLFEAALAGLQRGEPPPL